jgi:hypothetical protein
VIVPQRIAGDFVIEVEDDEVAELGAEDHAASQVARSGRRGRKR